MNPRPVFRSPATLLALCLGVSWGYGAERAGSPSAGSAPATRPNIILILTDDQGYGDLGITGNPVVQTPNIDALARRGASLAEFYVCPVCSPTRASLMTGRYNYRTGVVDTYLGRSMMNPAEVTLARVLKDAGYATGIFGKWHLGDCYPLRPIDRGFDEELVLRGGGLAQPADPIANRDRYTNPVLIHNGQEVATTGYCTDVYFDAAMKFMDEARAAG
ncbi:MAG: sulfatase-like hydrolase/transferase, partial [Verrucomicrobia bacterium]|nr:sulfatase-like hydrolase/transferase [Verrucomicrobiota bacterium]